MSDGINRAGQGFSSPILPPKQSEETQKRPDSLSSGITSGVDSGLALKKESSTQSLTPFQTVNRVLSEKDITEQLLQIKQSPSAENKQLLSTMIQHGIPATLDAFDDIKTLIKGNQNKDVMRAAVVSYAKGLGASMKGVEVLAQYYGNQTDLVVQMRRLQSGLSKLRQSASAKNLGVDPQVMAGLVSVLDAFNTGVTAFQNGEFGDNLKVLQRGKMIHEYKLMAGFLDGVSKKMGPVSTPNLIQIKRDMASLRESVKSMMNVLVSHAILSRDTMSQSQSEPTYYYAQYPNPMAPINQVVELLIQKEKKYQAVDINPEKTQVIVRLETPELGEVSIVIDLNQNKLFYQFHSDTPQTLELASQLSASLRDRMAGLNYELVGFKTVSTKKDVRHLLVPRIDLDRINRIITEA